MYVLCLRIAFLRFCTNSVNLMTNNNSEANWHELALCYISYKRCMDTGKYIEYACMCVQYNVTFNFVSLAQ